jgi:hypothetical protein
MIHGAAIYGNIYIPSIYPSHVSIYTSTMDPMGYSSVGLELENCGFMEYHGDDWNILEFPNGI